MNTETQYQLSVQSNPPLSRDISFSILNNLIDTVISNGPANVKLTATDVLAAKAALEQLQGEHNGTSDN